MVIRASRRIKHEALHYSRLPAQWDGDYNACCIVSESTGMGGIVRNESICAPVNSISTTNF